MYLFGSVVKKLTNVISQLCASYNTVVAENDTVVFQNGRIGNEFHLRHQITTSLCARGK